jgi:hypothetical protein
MSLDTELRYTAESIDFQPDFTELPKVVRFVSDIKLLLTLAEEQMNQLNAKVREEQEALYQMQLFEEFSASVADDEPIGWEVE